MFCSMDTYPINPSTFVMLNASSEKLKDTMYSAVISVCSPTIFTLGVFRKMYVREFTCKVTDPISYFWEDFHLNHFTVKIEIFTTSHPLE